MELGLIRRASTLVLLLAIGASTPRSAEEASAQDFDTVVLRNGNVITGEVEALTQGRLEFDTDAMDLVRIDWDDIVSISSSLIFEVTDVTGAQYYGSLSPGDRPGQLVVGLGNDTVTLPLAVVVELRNLAESFWGKTNGYVDLGTDIARANQLRSILFNGHFGFNGRVWEIDVDAESYFQSQQTIDAQNETTESRTSRNSLGLGGRRFFNAKWAATTTFELEQNEELNLDRRALLAAGGRFQAVRNPGLELFIGMSAVLNAERFTGEEAAGSGEINVQSGLDMFDIGDLDLYTSLNGYVSPGSQRYRINIDARASWELVQDFFIGFTVLEAYDSKPGEGASNRDFQYGFTLGWSWG